MILSVAVANVFEVEVTVEANEPAGETEEELCKRRVDVEVVFTENVVGSEFSKVDFVEATRDEKMLK